MIKQYDIIHADNASQLAARINIKVTEGWQPFGALCSDSTETETHLYQPIVRYQEGK